MPKKSNKDEEVRKEHFERFAKIIDNLFTVPRRRGFMSAALDSVEGMSRWTPENVKKTLEKEIEEEAKKKRKRGRSANPNSGILKVLLDVTAYGWLLEHKEVSQHIVFNKMKQEVQWANEERTEFRDWAEEDDYDILIAIQREGINVADKNIRLAVNRIAKINSFDPVLAWLKSLDWDGEERLHRLLPGYFKGADTPYSRAIGKMFMISAVARQFEPGCQVDHMLILEGQQGLYKTRGLEALFGKDYVNDNLMSIKGINASLGVKGFLAVNIDEMGTFKGNKLADLKSFITKREETYIRKYENRTTKEPRRCVFVGTTNESQYLFDDDNRRYWPFEVTGKIDKEIIERDRDQIWAEAVHLYRQGEQWWPTDELVPVLKAEQLKRQPHNPLVDQLHQFVWFTEKITISEICEQLYGRQSSADKGKASIIGRQLSKLGFTSSKHHGSLQYWHRPDPIPDEFQLIIAQMLDHERSRFVEKVLLHTLRYVFPPDQSEWDPLIYKIYHSAKYHMRELSKEFDEAKATIRQSYFTKPDTEDVRKDRERKIDDAYFRLRHKQPLNLEKFKPQKVVGPLDFLFDDEAAPTQELVYTENYQREPVFRLDDDRLVAEVIKELNDRDEINRGVWALIISEKQKIEKERKEAEEAEEMEEAEGTGEAKDKKMEPERDPDPGPDFFRHLHASELGPDDQDAELDENSFEYFKSLIND